MKKFLCYVIKDTGTYSVYSENGRTILEKTKKRLFMDHQVGKSWAYTK